MLSKIIQPTEEQKQKEEEVETVYHTRTGSKYHRKLCSYLRSSFPIALKDAVKRFSPCSRCNPPRLSAQSLNSFVDSRESTQQDSKLSALRFANVPEALNESRIGNERNLFSALFGNISAITLNNPSSAVNVSASRIVNSENKNASDNLFCGKGVDKQKIKAAFNPFLLGNRQVNDECDYNKDKKDNLGSDKARKIVKIIGTSEMINDPFIIIAADAAESESENAKADIKNNEDVYLNKNSNEEKLNAAEEKIEKLATNITNTSSSEADLISKLKAIIEEKFAERESKLTQELQKLTKKTDQQENQIKAMEEKNLELQVEIASLKRNNINSINNKSINNCNNNNNSAKSIKEKINKSIFKNNINSNNTEKQSTALHMITSESIFEIIPNASFENKIQIKNQSESEITEIQNKLKISEDKITKIEHALNFQSDLNKFNSEKLNYLTYSSTQSQKQLESFSNSLNYFMELIANMKSEIKDELRYSADFKIGLLKNEVEKIREIQLIHDNALNVNANTNTHINNDYAGRAMRNEFSRRFDFGFSSNKDSFEDRFGQAKSFVVSDAIIKDFYRKGKLDDFAN